MRSMLTDQITDGIDFDRKTKWNRNDRNEHMRMNATFVNFN